MPPNKKAWTCSNGNNDTYNGTEKHEDCKWALGGSGWVRALGWEQCVLGKTVSKALYSFPFKRNATFFFFVQLQLEHATIYQPSTMNQFTVLCNFTFELGPGLKYEPMMGGK
jgi:hypothetical protein